MELRDARFADEQALRALVAAAGLPVADLRVAPWLWVVAERAGSFAGVAAVEPCGEFGLLRSVAVAPGARGQGLGTALVEAASKRAVTHGFAALYLLTIDREPFFAARGFVTVARAGAPPALRASAEFSSLCPDSAVLMTRTLVQEGSGLSLLHLAGRQMQQ